MIDSIVVVVSASSFPSCDKNCEYKMSKQRVNFCQLIPTRRPYNIEKGSLVRKSIESRHQELGALERYLAEEPAEQCWVFVGGDQEH